MEVSPKEMRKLLNVAWGVGNGTGIHSSVEPPYHSPADARYCYPTWTKKERQQARYRDVSRILEAKKKEQRKDGRDGKT